MRESLHERRKAPDGRTPAVRMGACRYGSLRSLLCRQVTSLAFSSVLQPCAIWWSNSVTETAGKVYVARRWFSTGNHPRAYVAGCALHAGLIMYVCVFQLACDLFGKHCHRIFKNPHPLSPLNLAGLCLPCALHAAWTLGNPQTPSSAVFATPSMPVHQPVDILPCIALNDAQPRQRPKPNLSWLPTPALCERLPIPVLQPNSLQTVSLAQSADKSPSAVDLVPVEGPARRGHSEEVTETCRHAAVACSLHRQTDCVGVGPCMTHGAVIAVSVRWLSGAWDLMMARLKEYRAKIDQRADASGC